MKDNANAEGIPPDPADDVRYVAHQPAGVPRDDMVFASEELDPHEEMRRFLCALGSFDLGPDERLGLLAIPSPNGGSLFETHCKDAEDACREVLASLGPNCHLFVTIVTHALRTGWEADPTRRLGIWWFREREEGELGLSGPVTKVRTLPFSEPSLVIATVRPAGPHHVYDSRLYFHESRFRSGD